jgi:hypothetical protein
VNNAGILASPELRTPEGWEMQFGTNLPGRARDGSFEWAIARGYGISIFDAPVKHCPDGALGEMRGATVAKSTGPCQMPVHASRRSR